MSVLVELDELRSALSAPGQPYELTERIVNGTPLKVYKNLPVNLSHLIVKALDSYAERTFLVNGDQRFTFAEVIGQAAGLAEILRAKYGAGKDVRVAIAMKNSPEWIVSYLAIFLAGSTAVLVNSRGSSEELVNALEDTDCAVLIGDSRRIQAIGPNFSGTILLAEDGVFREHGGPIIDIRPAPVRVSAAGPDDPAIIMFTSGTTGRPKGAVLTHQGALSFIYGMLHNGAAILIRTARKLGRDPQSLAASAPQIANLGVFPFFHVSGAYAVILGAVNFGGKIVLMERWNPEVALSLIARERITALSGPPSIFWDMLNCPSFASTDLSSLTVLSPGGQATPPNLFEVLARVLPNASIGGGYGATETNGSVTSASGEEYVANPKGSGRVLPGVDIRIVSDDGKDQPLGGIGEVWVRSALVMAGYWNRPDANDAVFSDGWYKMGDIGYLDENRFLTIVDRKKDMIIRSGENIYSAELERVFLQYPGVLELAVFGVPDERLGERVVMTVVPQAGERLDPQEILAFGRTRLADYKVPSEIIFRLEPFVRNAVGKIDKVLLRKSYGTGA